MYSYRENLVNQLMKIEKQNGVEIAVEVLGKIVNTSAFRVVAKGGICKICVGLNNLKCMIKELKKLENKLLEFACSGIDEQGKFLIEHTGYGQDISPQFVIKNLSPSAKTIAITLEDLSHPIKGFTHWVIWNIPATNIITKAIPKGKNIDLYETAKQGLAYGWHRYAGPKPPKGKSHLYRFTIYALDCEIELSANVFKKSFLKKAAGHILQKGEITGEFATE